MIEWGGLFLLDVNYLYLSWLNEWISVGKSYETSDCDQNFCCSVILSVFFECKDLADLL